MHHAEVSADSIRGGWPLLLGGSMRPLGGAISFVEGPFDAVVAAVAEVHRRCEVSEPVSLRHGLRRLDPMEAPWTRELIVRCGSWTAYINNGRNGGDLTAVAPAVARRRGWRCIGAQHMDRHGPGHAATQLWIQAPDGEPPLGHVRTLAAHATDGRWAWYESGPIQAFEEPGSYQRRRVRDRLDRPRLVSYLDALGIRVDDPDFYGEGVVLSQLVDWPRSIETAADFRQANGW